MKRKKFTLSIKTLYFILIVIFAIIIFFQFYFLREAQQKLIEELVIAHTKSPSKIVDNSFLDRLTAKEKNELNTKGVLLRDEAMYIKHEGGIDKVNLKDTLVMKLGENLIYLNIIFDLLLIWIALYFYFKIFADISRVNTTIELSANGKFVPEKMPPVDVEGVDRIIENFKTIYIDFLNREKEVERKSHFESLGLISARIIHDLKNSLAYILIMIYKAKTLEPKKEVKEILSGIDLKVGELKLAMEDVLLALKDGRDFRIDEVDIEVFKSGLEREFDPYVKNLGINFKVNFDEKLLGKTLKVNPYQIKSAIENLIHNSIKVLEKKKGTDKRLGVDFIYEGENIKFVVWDNGEGVSESMRNNIFDSFISGDDKSIGLGLSNVKEFVEYNGGEVKLESDEGLTKFILTLPFFRSENGDRK